MTRRDHLGGVICALLIGYVIGAVTGPTIGQWLESLLR